MGAAPHGCPTADSAADDRLECSQKQNRGYQREKEGVAVPAVDQWKWAVVYGLAYNNGGSVMFAPRAGI